MTHSTSVSTDSKGKARAPLELNWSMQDLLSTLIAAIDERHGMLGNYGDDGLVPTPCPSCMGTGVVLVVETVPSTPVKGEATLVNLGSDDLAVTDEGADNVDNNIAGEATLVNLGSDDLAVTDEGADNVDNNIAVAVGASASGSATSAISAAGANIPTPSPAPAAPTAPATAPVVITAIAPAIAPVTPAIAPAIAPVTPAIAPAIAPVTPAIAPAIAPVTPAIAPAIAPVTPANPAPAVQPVQLPEVSVLAPGSNSIFGTPPPAPENALFTGPTQDRIYCITKGRRVGVVSGWGTCSHLVVGVPGSSYARHATLLEAYQAYVKDYNSQSVAYI
ncbi:hypothetical protein D9611_012824 [Ephemerocybe angulata]|uniref:Ribonuclease H1 N-terminal domain-containing protein n=1 Tax=Ephemerocybe angulata TaxID=980116 RepID=A0A8H5BCC3_9AGAR|nr:hypothetical protein D9611_012824 [Tulosesus angulatus]